MHHDAEHVSRAARLHAPAEPAEPSLAQRLDALAAWTQGALTGAGFTPGRVDGAFALQARFGSSPLHVRPSASRSSRSPLARVVRVDGGPQAQVFNVVIFPALHSPAPIFGCELLAFRRGLHLFVLDLFDTHEDEAPAPRALLKQGAQATLTQTALSPSALPAWGQHVFSPEALLIKPGPERPDEPLEPFEALFCRVLSAHLAALSSPAQPPLTALASERVRQRRALYLRGHAEEEPAGPFLARLAGQRWAHRFIHDYLYPRCLLERDDVASWAQPSPDTELPL